MTKHTSTAPHELGTRNKPAPAATNWLLIPVLSVTLLLCACAGPQEAQSNERRAKAIAMWQERCKTAGEKIHKTVDGVEGIFLMKIRPKGVNFGDQFAMDDPYGHDLGGDGYIESFLSGFYPSTPSNATTGAPARHLAYRYVEALDPKEGQRYRYTGRVEEPWQADKSYLKGYLRFVMDKAPATGLAPRYGVTYDDISTQEEREHWIAGSSLKVVDLQTNAVIAERIGYMVDRAQGSTGGFRSPWLFAADNACPLFSSRQGASAQLLQTEEFVEKVLKPAK